MAANSLSLQPLDAALRWYAVYVHSRHEKVVEAALRNKGYAAFSPTYRVRRKRTDRTVEIEVSLFPSYVFCRFDPYRRLPILTSPGVAFVVSMGDTPQPIEDSEIASLQSVVTSGRQVRPWPFLKQGQKVRVEAGPLAGAEGTYIQSKDESNLIVSVTLLQRAVSVTLEPEWVTPVF